MGRVISVSESSAESRIAELEAEIAQLRRGQDVSAGMRSLNLTVQKAREKMGEPGDLGLAASTWSSFCCVATVSSASSYCVAQDVEAVDPELAAAFVTLHQRAVEVMGEDGAVDAIIDQATKHEVVRVQPST
jgi:hypothetical protein